MATGRPRADLQTAEPLYCRYVVAYEAGSPVYEQIALLLRARIEQGEWRPRQRLTSATHLEQQYGVARQTDRMRTWRR
ncbi:GntR family transcriptional regulator [Nonomuraea sp. NEAU-L178]|nr:GntR family transcriptional regulator [Nonomuraea aurantiaca]